MSVSDVKQTLPKELMRNMLETMESAVPGLYEHLGKDAKRLKDICKKITNSPDRI